MLNKLKDLESRTKGYVSGTCPGTENAKIIRVWPRKSLDPKKIVGQFLKGIKLEKKTAIAEAKEMIREKVGEPFCPRKFYGYLFSGVEAYMTGQESISLGSFRMAAERSDELVRKMNSHHVCLEDLGREEVEEIDKTVGTADAMILPCLLGNMLERQEVLKYANTAYSVFRDSSADVVEYVARVFNRYDPEKAGHVIRQGKRLDRERFENILF